MGAYLTLFPFKTVQKGNSIIYHLVCFNKKYNVQNLTDLRMTVFDNDLLWVLEFLGAIDGSQHERLEICFTMRNTCAHPGETTVSQENILSFFSDLDTLVFNNPRFKIEVEHA